MPDAPCHDADVVVLVLLANAPAYRKQKLVYRHYSDQKANDAEPSINSPIDAFVSCRSLRVVRLGGVHDAYAGQVLRSDAREEWY